MPPELLYFLKTPFFIFQWKALGQKLTCSSLSVCILHHKQVTKLKTKSDQPFPKQVLVSMCQQYKSFENTVGKEKLL